MTLPQPTRRSLLGGAIALAATPAYADAGDAIRPLVLISKPQATDPAQYQAAQLCMQEWRKLGLKVTAQVLPATQQSTLVWLNRTKWDMTTWEMVGRPERSDPDELTYSLFHSSLAENGYDFVGYNNPEYDRLAEAQRAEEDRDKRAALVKQAQMVIKHDQPYIYLVYPRRSMAFNSDVWDHPTVVEEAGIGIRNFWTFLHAKPLGAQKDMILNAPQARSTFNPVHMDPIGSWVTDMIWDHLDARRRSRQPRSLGCLIGPLDRSHDRRGRAARRHEIPRRHAGHRRGCAILLRIAADDGQDAAVLSERREHRQGDDHRSAHAAFTLKSPQSSFFTSTLSKIAIIPKHVWKPIVDQLATTHELSRTTRMKS